MRPLALVLLILCLTAVPLAAGEKPNIILIVADDLGWADLGCYGSRYHRTPNLDRLASSGVRFTAAYAACPVCSPTRASILTGQYPQRYNLTDWLPGRPDRPEARLARPVINQQLPLEAVTLAEALKPAGYVSGHIGKWHLGGPGFGPLQQGFDSNIGGDETGTARSYFAPFKSKDGTFMPGLEQAPEGEYLTDRLTAEAEKFIEIHRQQPFFLHLNHYAPHTPLLAKPEMVARYKAGNHGQQGNPQYAAMLESLDQGIGRLLKKLEDLQLSEKTLILFTSDNGGLATLEGMPLAPTFNAPLREGKGYLYEGGIRIPLIVRWPGTSKAGTTSNALVSTLDFFPTLLEAAGVKKETPIDGISITAAIRGEDIRREALYWHYPHYANQGSRPASAIRAGDYKLIEFLEDGRRELFDVAHDIGENQNLVQAKPEVVKELTVKLEAWRRSVGARVMSPNPDYTPNPQNREGIIVLPARKADVHGVMLRYEPLPHKETLGYWVNASDWASWEFTVTQPGTFVVEVLQGCGTGQGGSEVEVAIGGQKVNFTVVDTGHFQNFKARDIGQIKIEQIGRHTLNLKPIRKANAAVMDIRAITLRPVK